MFSNKNVLVNQEQFTQLVNQLGLLLQADTNLIIDSRKITRGSVFCAYPGTQVDGRTFIPAAIGSGAAAILFETGYLPAIAIPNYPVKNLMHYVGLLAAHTKNYPSTGIHSIAITGTNGKTSISHWLNQAFAYLGQKTAIIGTIGCGIYPNVTDLAATTPDPITLQSLIKQFVNESVSVLAMEVSSHALDQGRVNGMLFKTAIFTNLTQDHLDYHKTMENYFAAKEQLFYWQSLENAIINLDDEYGVRLIKNIQQDNLPLNLISYGINDGDLHVSNLNLTLSGMSFTLHYHDQQQLISVPIVGKFNVSNLLAVFATLLCNGVKFSELAVIAHSLKPVVGRMDAKISTAKPLVIVDYSHTPDSLQKALETLHEMEHDKLICVFGCGGNRDKAKRPLMGRIAAELSDIAIVTSDNPRNEDPNTIINEILTGIETTNYIVEANRHEAIRHAILSAKPNDIVLIAGKGHEDYQEINGVKHHFSDLELRDEFLNQYTAILSKE